MGCSISYKLSEKKINLSPVGIRSENRSSLARPLFNSYLDDFIMVGMVNTDNRSRLMATFMEAWCSHCR
jgi:hypothetical protein